MVKLRSQAFFLLVLLICKVSVAAGTISISECEVAGVPFGADGAAVRKVFGPSQPQPDFCKDGCIDIIDYPYQYEGMLIIMHQDEAWRFTVSTPKCRLKSGIGVGSSRSEVTAAFGEAEMRLVDDREVLTYGVTRENGKLSRVFLDLTFLDEDVESFVVTLR